MASARLLILLSLIYCCFGAENEYKFCENTNGTIIVELDAVIDVKQGNETTQLRNIKQGNSTTSCTTEDKRSFEIEFEKGYLLKVIIEKQNNIVSLDELQVKSEKVMASKIFSNELSKSDEYYICNITNTYVLSSSLKDINVSVTFNKIKLQGFNVTDGSFSQKFSFCDSKNSTTTTATPTTVKTTTTQVPTTTTTPDVNTTTTPVVNTTTTQVPTTTTQVVNITTTTPMKTTTPKPTVSPSTPAQFDLRKNKTICVSVHFTGNLTFQYQTKDKKKLNYVHAINENDVQKIEGSCKGDSPYVIGHLSMGCSIEFRFSKVSKVQSTTRRLLAASFEYVLSNLTVTFDTSKPPGAVGGGVQSVSDKNTNVKASSGGTYKCNAAQTLLKKANTTLDVRNFQAGAFSPDKNGSVNECEADNNPGNNIVPIVVGVILACLVVIIIVAYLIGRRRNREGYQSV